MIIPRFNERKTQQLFDACNFEKQMLEIREHEDKFAGEYEQDFRQNFKDSPFKDSPVIVCRMSHDAIEMEGDEPTEEELLRHLTEKGLTNLQAYDTPNYDELPEVHKAVTWLTKQLEAEQVGRVMVARLIPGGHVLPHPDFGPYHDYYDRFHICVGGDGCLFRVGDETVRMLPGEIWWFRNNLEHESWNHGEQPRDHIIVDLKLRGDKNVFRTGGVPAEAS